MLSAIHFNLDESKILLSVNGLRVKDCLIIPVATAASVDEVQPTYTMQSDL